MSGNTGNFSISKWTNFTGRSNNTRRTELGSTTPGISSSLFSFRNLGMNTGLSLGVSGWNTGNTGDNVKRIAVYLLSILFVAFIILLFIHFFITPIFKLRPGSPGIISVPGWDDGKLFWEKGVSGMIKNTDLPIQNLAYAYSLNLDIFIQNPMQFSTHPRILFSRGATIKQKPSGELLLGVLDNYNLVIALLPDTTDLIVSVLNKNNHMENIIIPNIPVQDPFRIGVVVMEQALEVYINGHLMKTKSFDAPPKDVKGDIYPASGIEANVAKLRNLKIWGRVLTTPELRDALPKLSTKDEMGGGSIPSSSSCPSTLPSITSTELKDTLADTSKLTNPFKDIVKKK
jgi:hypothetical protein